MCLSVELAANSYTLPSMIGPTVQSGKRQAPCYSIRGPANNGAFSRDCVKVRDYFYFVLTLPACGIQF